MQKFCFAYNISYNPSRQRPLYLHVQGKNQEQVNSKFQKQIHVTVDLIYFPNVSNSLCAFFATSEAVMRIKEIISEDLLRASAASGGQQVPIMPPITLYPQPPRPVIPPPVPRMSNATAVPGQGHRPAAPHTGVSKHQ